MALFKEINCAHCGKKTNMLFRTKLADEQYVCNKCTSKIPSEITSHLDGYEYDDFKDLKDYLVESDTQLKKEFKETHSFYSIHADTEHDLFYLDNIYPRVYFKLENLEDFDLSFRGETYKEGFLSDKVTGKLYYKVKVSFPAVFVEGVLAEDVKAPAKVKGIFKDKVEYDNPAGMDDFIHFFVEAWNHAKLLAYERARIDFENLYSQSSYEDAYQASSDPQLDELQQAMALFMIDDLSAVTLSDIKAQRNRLIKVYHPDTGDASDTPYAQKINNAYAVLKKQLGG